MILTIGILSGAKQQGYSTFSDHLGLRVSEGRGDEGWGSEEGAARHAPGNLECPRSYSAETWLSGDDIDLSGVT